MFVRVVGPEFWPRERPLRNVPYLLASAEKGERPEEGAAAS